jgi:MFS family permease
MGVSLTVVAYSFSALRATPESATSVTSGGIITLVALVVFMASFAFSMGPVVWTLISEIYPNRVRGRAIAVATAFNWLAAFLVAQSFLSFVDAIGESATFLIFAIMCVVSVLFTTATCPRPRAARSRRSRRLDRHERTRLHAVGVLVRRAEPPHVGHDGDDEHDEGGEERQVDERVGDARG